MYFYCHIYFCAYCVVTHTDKFTFLNATTPSAKAVEEEEGAHSLPTAAFLSTPFFGIT
jgi:hypothetical protein